MHSWICSGTSFFFQGIYIVLVLVFFFFSFMMLVLELLFMSFLQGVSALLKNY